MPYASAGNKIMKKAKVENEFEKEIKELLTTRKRRNGLILGK